MGRSAPCRIRLLHGPLTTDALNGEAEGGLFPFSTVNLEVGAINGQIDGVGYFVDSFITFDVAGENPCPADTDEGVLCTATACAPQ